mgnify:CR=1 FL=1
MGIKNKEILLFKRLFIWILYLFAGFVLYSKKGYLYPLFITFAKVIYPLSIFWLQIRLKTKGNYLPIDSAMTTSQLWFNLLPVISSFMTIILCILNVFLYLTDKLI